jgi:serine protease Do
MRLNVRQWIAVLLLLAASLTARARDVAAPIDPAELHRRVSPALVAVQYTWAYEFGRIEFVGPGVVVREDGLVMIPLPYVGSGMPDEQLVEWKIIVPSRDADPEELDAVFQGRDERSSTAFVKPRETGRTWTPVVFEEVDVEIGEPVWSIGMLPRDAGYTTYLARGMAGARLRGEVPAVLVTEGGLAAAGGPVFNAAGTAIGVVLPQSQQQVFLHTSSADPRRQPNTLAAVNVPPALFAPTREFALSLKAPPTPEAPIRLPWIGTPQLTGLARDVAEAFGLANRPAIEIGDVMPQSPAEKAGLKVGMKIVKFNGEPLERGDLPEELPQILSRHIRRLPVGSEVTFGVVTEKDKPLEEIRVTLEQRPKRANEVRRFWADDLGFSAREIVLEDAYTRNQPPDIKGVVVGIVKRESSAAAANLDIGDVITSLNGVPVTDLAQFETAFQSFRKERPREPLVLVVMKPDATTSTVRVEPPQ